MQTDIGRERTGRLGLMSRLLTDALHSVTRPGIGPSVLDCGGGSGTYAVPLAALGATVTVIDISADALATLSRRAAEAGVVGSVRPVQGDVENLAEVIGGEQFDLVLAHGILESVDEPEAAFAAITEAARAGAIISALVGNPVAAVIARALAGEPRAALSELRDLDAPGGRISPAAIEQLARNAGLTVEGRHGVGVFSDLVPGSALDAPGARDALDRLDAEAADRFPFADIASRVHLLLRRPA